MNSCMNCNLEITHNNQLQTDIRYYAPFVSLAWRSNINTKVAPYLLRLNWALNVSRLHPMSIERDYKYVAKWIASDGSISFEPQYNGSYFIVASDESEMAVAFVYDRLSIDKAFSKLDRALKNYMASGETLDEINAR